MKLMFLADNDTYTELQGCTVIELPDDADPDEAHAYLQLLDWKVSLERTGEVVEMPVFRVREGDLND